MRVCRCRMRRRAAVRAVYVRGRIRDVRGKDVAPLDCDHRGLPRERTRKQRRDRAPLSRHTAMAKGRTKERVHCVGSELPLSVDADGSPSMPQGPYVTYSRRRYEFRLPGVGETPAARGHFDPTRGSGRYAVRHSPRYRIASRTSSIVTHARCARSAMVRATRNTRSNPRADSDEVVERRASSLITTRSAPPSRSNQRAGARPLHDASG